MIAEKCWPCIVGLHEECYQPERTTTDDVSGPWMVCCCASNPEAEATVWTTEVGRPVKEPSEIDGPEAIKNTGRKRAQMLYPIYDPMVCEWAWLKQAGGGPKPIIGCAGNTIRPTKEGPEAGHRHHGPNKNTIANEPGNVHRICATCHVRWHALNNEFYGERPPADQPYLPREDVEWEQHNPVLQATDEEREEWEAWWKNRRVSAVDED